MTQQEISEIVHKFIQENFLFDSGKRLDDNESFVGSGVIDSTGIQELISFLEERFDITFQDDELVRDNLDSVSSVSTFLYRKVGQLQRREQ